MWCEQEEGVVWEDDGEGGWEQEAGVSEIDVIYGEHGGWGGVSMI